MTTSAKLTIAIACLALLSSTGIANAQSGQKKMSDDPAAQEMAEPVSRAFTNGYNVPSSGVAIKSADLVS